MVTGACICLLAGSQTGLKTKGEESRRAPETRGTAIQGIAWLPNTQAPEGGITQLIAIRQVHLQYDKCRSAVRWTDLQCMNTWSFGQLTNNMSACNNIHQQCCTLENCSHPDQPAQLIGQICENMLHWI